MPMALWRKIAADLQTGSRLLLPSFILFCRNGTHTVLFDFKLKGINTAGLAGLHILPVVRQQFILGNILAQSISYRNKNTKFRQ